MTTEVLLGIGGSLLSLLFEFVPGFKGWYLPKDPYLKRMIMILLLLAGTVIVFGLACSGVLGALNWKVVCDAEGAWALFRLFLVASTSNQVTHLLVKKS